MRADQRGIVVLVFEITVVVVDGGAVVVVGEVALLGDTWLLTLGVCA